ncbi:MAG: hypothetical protein D6733_03645 [Methanobacteriota archaeon]|nr:MAG: hypothetical protein D6733_03645 [Euryarchaeota archaeon]
MKEKENLAESEFKEWLDKHNIPYFYIHQAIDTFSQALRTYMTKRPDFMILVPHVGFIIVDVEYKKPAKKYDVFQIDEEETKQYCNLQNYFNLQVWYVFSSEGDHYNTWHWIPASKVLECGECYTNPNNQNYRAVPISKFVTVSKNDNLGRLFSEMSKFY